MTAVPEDIIQNKGAHGLVWHEANGVGFLLIWHRRTQKTAHFFSGPVKSGQDWKTEQIPDTHGFQFERCLINSAGSTLIPAPFWQEENAGDFRKFHFGANAAGTLDYNPTLDGKAVLLFLHQEQAASSKFHPGTVLLPIWKSLPAKTAYRIFGWLLGDILHMACFDGQQLKLYNSFPVSSIEETAYYLLYAAEQLEFPLGNTGFQMGGIPYASEQLEQLQQYIPQVKLLDNLPGTIPQQVKLLLEQTALCA